MMKDEDSTNATRQTLLVTLILIEQNPNISDRLSMISTGRVSSSKSMT